MTRGLVCPGCGASSGIFVGGHVDGRTVAECGCGTTWIPN